MPPRLHPREEILNKLFEVFRTYGYEGASLARIAEATGLGRASLYHHFPGGKEEMAQEVLAAARGWLTQNVVASLGSQAPLGERWKATLDNLEAGYQRGEVSCVLNLLGVGDAGTLFQQELQSIVIMWRDVFRDFFAALGYSQERSTKAALDAIVRIEGALVVGRALGQPEILQDVLRQLEHEHSEVKAELPPQT